MGPLATNMLGCVCSGTGRTGGRNLRKSLRVGRGWREDATICSKVSFLNDLRSCLARFWAMLNQLELLPKSMLHRRLGKAILKI